MSLTVKLYELPLIVPPNESVTTISYEVVDKIAVGIPVIDPVLVLNDNPLGNVAAVLVPELYKA
jgi:hypothetical protein